jgi:hypothetical protein
MDRSQTVLDQVLDTLRAFRGAARDAGVELVGVVGSVARGDAMPDSDVDVAFDASGDLDYWRLGGLQMDLQDALGRRVDLVDRLMMRPERWTYMSQDFVAL